MKEFTIKETAEYINKSESWIRKKILSNELEAEKEVIEVVEKEKSVSKEVILNELTEAINKQNRALVDDVVDKVDDN